MQEVFNRNILKMHRDRAANKIYKSDFLFKHSFENILDRIYIYKDKYSRAVNIGARIFDFISLSNKKVDIDFLVNTDLSSKMLKNLSGNRVQADEEFLPFLNESFDLAVSNLNLHSVNDLPGTLVQIQRSLKESGLFVASFIGENSLKELKEVLIKSEVDVGRNMNFHVSPTISSDMLSSLMVRAQFKDVVVDKDTVKIIYKTPQDLLIDLQNSGESNCMSGGKIRYIGKDVLKKFNENYYKMFPDEGGGVVCTFDIITCVGHK
ncbi:MAG: methyltransferase domain-containing protein [Alphaproteobacteria bacterium]|nr:methyltransferase domain-containing protein [Alphaproteobacteria bacterium]